MLAVHFTCSVAQGVSPWQVGGSAYDDFLSIGFISTLAPMHPCMHLHFATFAEK